MTTVPDFMPVLSRGNHDSPKEGACVMEYVSFLAGEKFSDHPTCTLPVFTEMAISLNDNLEDGARQRMVPLVARLLGANTDDPYVLTGIAIAMMQKADEVWWSKWSVLGRPLIDNRLRDAWVLLSRWARHED